MTAVPPAPRWIDSLERFSVALPALVGGATPDEARFREKPDRWSLLEVVTHLADEEVEDFRIRTRMTLEDPSQAWPPIDPAGAVVDRCYNDGDLGEALERFVRERRDSIAWLRGLRDPDWTAQYTHPVLGPLRAGDLLASWAAHDLLHLRQLTRLRFLHTQRAIGDYETRYAGEWP